MIALPQFEAFASVAVGRVINSLPEGILIALFAWAVLRLLPKQNSRTRFAVWFLALFAIVGIACTGGLLLAHTPILGGADIASAVPEMPTAISLPAHWASYLFIVWIAAACLAVARIAAGIIRLRQLRQSSSPVDPATLDPSIQRTLDDLKSSASRPVILATSAQVRVPAALGLWKPIIVLPAWALAELAPADLAIILRHEFAHLRRWDDWTNLAQKIVRALFFFHPAIWWIESRLSVEREMACDDVVVAQTGNPLGYASCLISLLERSLAQRGWTMAQAIVHRAREASDRLTRILDKNRPSATHISKPAMGLVAAFALLCVVMLPQAPQFVAFDRSPLPPADHDYSAGLAQPAIVHTEGPAFRAAIIPAALKTTPHPAPLHPLNMNAQGRFNAQAKLGAEKFSAEKPNAQKPNAPAINARLMDQPPSQKGSIPTSAPATFYEAAMFADQGQPVMQTLVVMETEQILPAPDEQFSADEHTTVTPTLWRVQIWQVTITRATWKHAAPVSVASKT